ncbi:unnamed protein product [Pseudo-nitzschia multistriata]|uniref:phosphatidylinositol 3-kinase n=1 Tax=Pseudo-nitzschia multistriata TaxID=183589 RepID=A0A448ZQV5_9STRA|nr:unnamed protein product [Pseudo-nitzschia multistriata]
MGRSISEPKTSFPERIVTVEHGPFEEKRKPGCGCDGTDRSPNQTKPNRTHPFYNNRWRVRWLVASSGCPLGRVLVRTRFATTTRHKGNIRGTNYAASEIAGRVRGVDAGPLTGRQGAVPQPTTRTIGPNTAVRGWLLGPRRGSPLGALAVCVRLALPPFCLRARCSAASRTAARRSDFVGSRAGSGTDDPSRCPCVCVCVCVRAATGGANGDKGFREGACFAFAFALGFDDEDFAEALPSATPAFELMQDPMARFGLDWMSVEPDGTNRIESNRIESNRVLGHQNNHPEHQNTNQLSHTSAPHRDTTKDKQSKAKPNKPKHTRTSEQAMPVEAGSDPRGADASLGTSATAAGSGRPHHHPPGGSQAPTAPQGLHHRPTGGHPPPEAGGPPRSTSSGSNTILGRPDPRLWATVAWMPHASLSQTSHVAVSVRAALATVHGGSVGSSSGDGSSDAPTLSWRVGVAIKGLAGLELAPVGSETGSAPLLPLGHLRGHPSVTGATHACVWDRGGGSSSNSSSHNNNNNNSTSHNNTSNSNSHKTSGGLLQVPLRWRDLPRDACLEFTVASGNRRGDASYEPARLSLFDDYGRLRSGLNRVPLRFRGGGRKRGEQQKHQEQQPPPPPPKQGWQRHDDDPVWKASKILEQLDRFEDQNSSGNGNSAAGSRTTAPGRGSKRPPQPASTQQQQQQQNQQQHPHRQLHAKPHNPRHYFGDVPSVPWLDRMARDHCEEVLEEARTKARHLVAWPPQTPATGKAAGASDEARDDALDTAEDPPPAWLVVEIPSFDVPVVHEETFYPVPRHGPSGSVHPSEVAEHKQQQRERQHAPPPTTSHEPPPFHPLGAVPFLDYENENDSPTDDKYRTLAHDLLRGLVDPALKPDRKQRDKLAAIIASPSHHPTRAEKDLLWRFRFSLVDNHRALAKFLLAVDWTVESEAVQASELLEQWRKRSPIAVTDALKLLGKQVAYQTNLVRAYAIDTLEAAPDEELGLYLLQLVQALKFENSLQQQQQQETTAEAGSPPVDSGPKKSSLATFLIARASKNVLLANYLYWYLKVELQDPAHGARYREIFDGFRAVLSATPYPRALEGEAAPASPSHPRFSSSSSSSLAASAGPSASSLVNKLGESVSKLGDKLLKTDSGHPSGNGAPGQSGRAGQRARSSSRSVWEVLSDQDRFISGVMDAQMSYSSKARQPAKEAHLRSVLEAEGVFRSAVYPALIEFHALRVVDKAAFAQDPRPSSRSGKRGAAPPLPKPPPPTLKRPGSYRVLMKTGDDLRQDQLVMMMIKLMDRLLKRASLDLCITPYSIIATSPSSGMIEFVEDSVPLSAILANHNNSIARFFRSVAPQAGARHGIRPDVLSSYVRSVAGGCVLTYLLGVGDRHLDNLMITKTGRFFHIDFGFLFGRDPKPLPPAFRLTREMVEGMGGSESAEYRQFCSLACQAFNALRKSAGLVLNLLHLMSDAGIEDLSNNPSADADGVIAKVEERFKLDLTDEQAERFFLGLIHESQSALAPRLMDVFHSIAVARR